MSLKIVWCNEYQSKVEDNTDLKKKRDLTMLTFYPKQHHFFDKKKILTVISI